MLGLHWSFKRTHQIPIRRNTERAIDQREVYANQFDEVSTKYDWSNIIYVDEVGFNVTLRRFYGRAPRGQPSVTRTNGVRGLNYSACAAMSCTGPIYFKTKKGAYNTDSFIEFLNELLVQLETKGPCILIMDNVRFHGAGAVRNLIASTQHELMFLPPYSPFLNPIEEMFSKWKGAVRQCNVSNEDELFAGMDASWSEITASDCAGWERHSRSFLLRCKRREIIE